MLPDMPLGKLHEVLEIANARAFGAIQGDGLFMDDSRRCSKEGTQLRTRLGSHIQVVHRAQQVRMLVWEKEDMIARSHSGTKSVAYGKSVA
jgi:hypothetical protein